MRHEKRLLLSAIAFGIMTGCGTSKTPEGTGPGASASDGNASQIGATQIRAFADAVAVEGFTAKGPAAVSDASARLVFSGPARPSGASTELTLVYTACDPVTCPKLDAATMAERAPKLRDALSPAAKANPDLVFEVLGVDFPGGTAYGTYTLFMTRNTDPDGGVTTFSGNVVSVYFHDTRQLVHVEAKAKDWGAEAQAAFLANTPRAELESAAKAGLAAAVKAFQK